MITFNDGGTPPIQYTATELDDLNHTFELDLDFPSEYVKYITTYPIMRMVVIDSNDGLIMAKLLGLKQKKTKLRDYFKSRFTG